MNYLFDLDGTLTDPGLGITNSVMYALEKLGIRETNRQALYSFIGPPLWKSFEQQYNLSPAQAENAVAYYREYFAETSIYQNEVYPGMRGLLQTLQAAGHTLVVATSKPTFFAQKVLDYFDLTQYFAFISGGTLDGSLVEKADIIACALAACRITDLDRTIMIGDRRHDVLGAQAQGIRSVGVLFGYGDRAELQAAGADFIAETVADLTTLLTGRGTLVV